MVITQRYEKTRWPDLERFIAYHERQRMLGTADQLNRDCLTELYKEQESRLDDYAQRCRQHDWFYQYSDDSSVYRKGHDNENRLRNEAMFSELHKTIWDQWSKYRRANGPEPTRGMS